MLEVNFLGPHQVCFVVTIILPITSAKQQKHNPSVLGEVTMNSKHFYVGLFFQCVGEPFCRPRRLQKLWKMAICPKPWRRWPRRPRMWICSSGKPNATNLQLGMAIYIYGCSVYIYILNIIYIYILNTIYIYIYVIYIIYMCVIYIYMCVIYISQPFPFHLVQRGMVYSCVYHISKQINSQTDQVLQWTFPDLWLNSLRSGQLTLTFQHGDGSDALFVKAIFMGAWVLEHPFTRHFGVKTGSPGFDP